MARARQELEEYEVAVVACFEANGAQASVGIGGSVGGIAVTHDDEGREIPGAIEQLMAATEICGEQVMPPAHWLFPKDESAYERMLDVRECIVAQGHEIPETPSFEVWIEQDVGEAWNPYLYLFPHFRGGANPLSEDELVALLDRCPQFGIGSLNISRIPD
jgi:hypothetical protein